MLGEGMEPGPTATSTSIEKWSDKIDDFGPMKPHAQACLAALKTHTAAQAALYEGAPPDTATKARKEFLDFLQFELMPKLQRREPANENGIELKELLGPEGFKKYEAAMQEEVQSRAFRDAVMQRATNHYDGEKWAQRLIAPFGGPSAAGKSVSQPALIREISSLMPKTSDMSGNDVVSIDGGVEREVSQIRGMVLQVALAKGYKGITDLDKHKPKIAVKKLVEKAALETPGLSIIIPVTYTNEAAHYVKGVPGRGSVGKDQFKKYDKVDDGNAILAFGIVEAEHDNVVKNGNSRAWCATEFTERNIRMNGKPPCESKAYHDHYKSGTTLSTAAKENYLHLEQADRKPRICVTVTSDYTFIKPDPSARCGWSLAKPEDAWNMNMRGLLKRDFEKFEKGYAEFHQKKLYEFENAKINAVELAKSIEDLKVQISTLDPASDDAKAKLIEIQTIQGHLDHQKQKITDLIKVMRSSQPDALLKLWLKENGWSPPIVGVQTTEPKIKPETQKPTQVKNVTFDVNVENIDKSVNIAEQRPGANIHHSFAGYRVEKTLSEQSVLGRKRVSDPGPEPEPEPVPPSSNRKRTG